MSRPIIEVTHLSKVYRLGEIGASSLREEMSRLWSRKSGTDAAQAEREFWALRDVSFTVQPGEVVGIIGRNGAGKSTLLKVLSRITEPTSGHAVLRGRVASLLEVGTGFHPDLSGRDNIFLNGAILGMKRAEIRAKLDEIVAFAEVEKFIDTPVKRYSSGMYVRLAFAVAAHLEPEILILDEVLAVGDAEFQKKCLGRMKDVAAEGRTVLFVSHDMSNTTRLCDRGVLLAGGRVEFQGDISATVARYLGDSISREGFALLKDHANRSGSGAAQFRSVELLQGGARCTTLAFGQPVVLRVGVEVLKPAVTAKLAAIISTSDGVPIHGLESAIEGRTWQVGAGHHEFEIAVAQLRLVPGSYTLDLWLGDLLNERLDYVRHVLTFQVVQTPESGLAASLHRNNGIVFLPAGWQHRRLD